MSIYNYNMRVSNFLEKKKQKDKIFDLIKGGVLPSYCLRTDFVLRRYYDTLNPI